MKAIVSETSAGRRPDILVIFLLSLGWASAGLAADFDLQGHRGARGLKPENTIAAFEKALELGVTTIELDVVMTRDGVFAVHHDLKLNPKICRDPLGGSLPRQPLAELDFADIAELDCGSQRLSEFPDQKLTPGERIPRLEQVLDLANAAPYPVRVSIELKQSIDKMSRPLEETVALLVALLRQRDLEDRTIVQSKWGEVLTEIREQAPSIERSIILRIASEKRWVENGIATIVSRKHVSLKRSEVRQLETQGIRVIPWTVNSPKAMQKLIDWGVDGLITDYPDRALAILNSEHD